MATQRSALSCFAYLAVSLVVTACSSNTPTPQGGNGGQGFGGATSSGGAVGSGGAGSGGAAGAAQTGSGGALSMGGTSATSGGAPGATGGAASVGGSIGRGGTTTAAGGDGGSAGSTGSGGAMPGSGGRSGLDAGAGRDATPSGSGGMNTGGSVAPDAGSSPGTGGSGGYNPCKSSPCKILPLGDSITHGYGSSDDAGYRSQLFKLIVAASQNVTFTGSLSNGPSTVSGKTFVKNHEGHDGYTVESGYSTYGTAGISSLIPSPAFTTVPDIVLLHIGTNDLTSSNSKATTSDRLDTELGRIVSAAPDALIVVAKVIPLGYSSSDWDTYNSKIPGLVQAHAAKGQHMVMVDMSKLPTSQLNGVHPTDQGYATMAGNWYETIKSYLPN
jgi:lysophospholipase L1-like esterase